MNAMCDDSMHVDSLSHALHLQMSNSIKHVHDPQIVDKPPTKTQGQGREV